jgi:hypothetical protein
MRFTPLVSGTEIEHNALMNSFRDGHTIGPVTVSDGVLFIKKGLRTYFIAYDQAQKIFRRVRRLHANICCGDGDIEVEYLVILSDDRELMEITLPGKKAARQLMDEIKAIAPSLDTMAPARQNDSEADV